MKTTAYLTKEPCPAVLDELKYLSDRSQVTVVATDEAYIDYYEKKGYNVITSEDYLSDTTMKFTANLGNPPYIKNMHLDFLLAGLDRSEYVSLIHPGGWLFRNTSKIEKRVKASLHNRVRKLELVNGNHEFPGAEFGAPLVVTTADKEHTGDIEVVYRTSGNRYTISSLNEFPTGLWEPTVNNLNLVSKFKGLSSKSSLIDIMGNYDGSSVSLSTPRVCGHVSKKPDRFISDDFFTLFYKNSNIYNIDPKNKVFTTQTEYERDSLVSYLKTKVARFGLAINKISQDSHISRYIETIPLPELNTNWTEESIVEYYGLSSEEVETINNIIPDYYG